MTYSGIVNKKGSEKEYIQTAKLIKYGLSNDQIADVLEKDSRTIENWVKAIAEKSQNFGMVQIRVTKQKGIGSLKTESVIQDT